MEAGALVAQTDSASRARPSAVLGRERRHNGRSLEVGAVRRARGARTDLRHQRRGKLAAWHGTVAYAASKAVPEILLVIATVLELVGGIGVVLGFKARWAAVALLVFLIPVTLVFHNFWFAPANEQQIQLVNFLKNLSIAGGALIVFAKGAGAFSIDAIGARARSDPLGAGAAR